MPNLFSTVSPLLFPLLGYANAEHRRVLQVPENEGPQRVDTALSEQSLFPGDVMALRLDSQQLFTDPDNTFLRLYTTVLHNKTLPSLDLALEPRLLGSASMTATMNVSVIHGNTQFRALGKQGVQIFEISDTSEKLIGHYEFPQAVSVALQNTQLWVNDTTQGDQLAILDLSQWLLSASPTTWDVGNYLIALSAVDEWGGTASDQFTIRVEGQPTFTDAIAQQYAKVGLAFNYFIPQGLVFDPNFDPLSFSATLTDSSPIPDWLRFNGISASLVGTPQSQHVANYTLRLHVTDNIAGTIYRDFSLYVDHIPEGKIPITPQVAGIGTNYTYVLPSETIIDPDGDSLTYSLFHVHDHTLPNWLHFDTNTLTLTASPTATHAGQYPLLLTAHDPYGGETSVEFPLVVEYAPYVNGEIPTQLAGVGQSYLLDVPIDLFGDLDGDPLVYSAIHVNHTQLPGWLNFSPQKLQFSGTPLASAMGVYPLELIAYDPAGAEASLTFSLTVTHFPEVLKPIQPPDAWRSGRTESFSVDVDTFRDLDDAVLSYNATLKNGDALPGWLTFDAHNITFHGSPLSGDEGRWEVVVSASDALGSTAEASVTLTILPNFSPTVVNPISFQTARVNEPFLFFVPEDTFIDRNGDELHYRALQVSGENLPAWLVFKSDVQEFSGTPSHGDTDTFSDRVIEIQLLASDSMSQTPTTFNLNVQGDSYGNLFIKYGLPSLSVLGTIYGIYRNRALCFNRIYRNQYQKIKEVAVTGAYYEHVLSTPKENVAKIQMKCLKPSSAYCDFFRSPRNRLPGGRDLPYWLEYDETKNSIRTVSGQMVPEDAIGQYVISVKDKGGIVKEQFEFEIEERPASALTHQVIPDDELGLSEGAMAGAATLPPPPMVPPPPPSDFPSDVEMAGYTHK